MGVDGGAAESLGGTGDNVGGDRRLPGTIRSSYFLLSKLLIRSMQRSHCLGASRVYVGGRREERANSAE